MSWQYNLDTISNVIGVTDAISFPNVVINSVSTDTRTIQPGALFFALEGENFDGNAFIDRAISLGASAVVAKQPCKSGPGLVVANPLIALQQFAAFHRQKNDARIIAITGSCGKTTAKDMITAVLASRYRTVKTQGNLNNEIGCPLSLLQLQADTEFAVIEMGANHPGEIYNLCRIAVPDEAAITMVAPAHLEGFGSIADVASAKSEILMQLPQDGCFYVNTDNSWCVDIAKTYLGRKVTFGRQAEISLSSVSFDADGLLCMQIEPIGLLKLPLAIPAHAMNVLLAVAIGVQHGVVDFQTPLEKVCENPSRGRLTRLGPLLVLDDTYNANPTSMEAALEALASQPVSGKRFAVLGEMLELGDMASSFHRNIGEIAGKLGIDYLLARGPHACDMISGALDAGVQHAEVLEEHKSLAQTIHELARPGDMLLLKGSRGMRMELVLQHLTQLYDGQAYLEET